MQLHFRFSGPNFRQQLPGGNTKHTAAQAGKLYQTIGGSNPDGIIGADFSGQCFNIGISGLSFGSVNDADVVPDAAVSGTALLLIAVKNQHQSAFFEAGIAAQNVTQPPPGGIQIFLSQRCQIIPGEDDIVAIYK